MSEITVPCQYYALCTHNAVGVTTHPVLDYVPTCQRCADRHGLTIIPAEFVAD